MQKITHLWKNIIKEIETNVSVLTFDLWIAPLVPVCISRDRLVLLAETPVAADLSYKKCHDIILRAAKKVFAAIADIEIITENVLPTFEQYRQDEVDLPDDAQSSEDDAAEFVSQYTFDSFVVGKSNEFAVAAARAVAEKPGSKYNPLFLYGGVGLGKTHLMHAIGNYQKENLPDKRVIYISAERFTNQLIDALRDTARPGAMKQLRKKYRTTDVLMIDDIQFIARTKATQEEIFHTFNDLYLAGKQIIISSDRPPKEISPLEERLRTRFECGLLADISQPDIEMRIAILQKMCLSENVAVNREILQQIAEKVTSNIRELKGLLTRVISYASLTGSDVNDLDAVYGALKDYTDSRREVLTMNGICQEVAAYYNIDQKEILGKKKTKEIILPRHVCVFLICEFLSLPLMNIGEFFGGRDHTTIMHARDKIGRELKENPQLAAQVKDIKDMILKR